MNPFAILERDFCRVIGNTPRPHDPMVRTQADELADALIADDNRQRYMQQSAATRDGSPAPLPARARLGGPLSPVGAGAGTPYDIEETLDAQDRETDPEFAFCYGGRNG